MKMWGGRWIGASAPLSFENLAKSNRVIIAIPACVEFVEVFGVCVPMRTRHKSARQPFVVLTLVGWIILRISVIFHMDNTHVQCMGKYDSKRRKVLVLNLIKKVHYR